MKNLLKNIIKTVFIGFFIVLSGCNNESFDPSEGLSEKELLEPTMGTMIDFDECYEDWSLSIEQPSADGTYVPLDLSSSFLREDVEYSKRKLITYNNDRYTYISLIYLYKRSDSESKTGLTYTSDAYNVIQLYGLDYSVKINGTKKDTYKEEEIDINMVSFSFNPLNNSLEWSIELFDCDDKGNKTEHIIAKGHENGNEKKFQHFLLRRNLKRGYFAINYKRVGTDRKIIEHFYENKFSFKIEYYTSKRAFLL